MALGIQKDSDSVNLVIMKTWMHHFSYLSVKMKSELKSYEDLVFPTLKISSPKSHKTFSFGILPLPHHSAEDHL